MEDILIIAGSASDMPIIEKIEQILKDYDVSYSVEIASAHRNPEKVSELSQRDVKVFIAVAGLAAALPGVIASQTKKPVIGVPIDSALGGLDALLSIVQMPRGVPVACVGINNGQNAAYLALRILGKL
ncbi:MAG: 5-(carboxyamino)imidazole ribonucleotide mutase [Candidatus Methanofastidiosia archaeon]